MRQNIAMDEIPFAPILSNTVPPVEPPAKPLPVKQPQTHHVVAWRNDGGLDSTRHETAELALAFARTLHWAVYYKYAIQVGRDVIARAHISEPEGYAAQFESFLTQRSA